MDIVFIHNFEIKTKIGVFEWEHDILQTLIFDIEMAWNNSLPAKTDDITAALDYSKVTEFIRFYCQNHQYELIETLAERLCENIMLSFAVPWLSMQIKKPGAIEDAVVGVKIERGQKV
ncbi:dihydroneopterin aldolase [Gayadomonas joobiniege]|uniref:dihydroneopterin aldolase n=1 Tax=Gayadomonas joobiniege TaxID=1234606 RepID=UPI00035EFFEC|nr:dihydroneopterin aldolase [Gayadomonas joobiniege]